MNIELRQRRRDGVVSRIVSKCFEGRSGHGRGVPVVYRQMGRAELALWLELAYDTGRNDAEKGRL